MWPQWVQRQREKTTGTIRNTSVMSRPPWVCTPEITARWTEVRDLENGVHAITERLGKIHRLFWEDIRKQVPRLPPDCVLSINQDTKEIVWYAPDTEEPS